MSLKSFLLILVSAATATTSMALFKKVLQGSYGWKGSFWQFLQDTLALLGKPLFLLACFLFVTSNLVWLIVLATQKLSMAYPIQIGLVFIMTGLVSAIVFSESISLRSYVGYLLLIVGVSLVSLGR
ncbi:MAG: hypothetical protein AAF984_04025 [Verrucomicrobiota bacterium]